MKRLAKQLTFFSLANSSGNLMGVEGGQASNSLDPTFYTTRGQAEEVSKKYPPGLWTVVRVSIFWMHKLEPILDVGV